MRNRHLLRYPRLIAAVITAVIGTVLPVHSFGQDSNYSQELAEVRSQIDQMKKQSAHFREERQAVENDIVELEGQLRSLESRRKATRQEINEQNQQLAKLESRKAELIVEIEKQSAHLGNLIRSTFAISRIDYVKVVLTEDNPFRFSRSIAYFRYLANARARQIEELQVRSRELETVETELQQRQASLAALASDLVGQRSELQGLKDKMQTTVAHFNEQLRSNEAALKTMLDEENRLLGLIESLKSRQSRGTRHSFARMKGDLALPVDSVIQARFGQPKKIRGAYWNGLLFSVSEQLDVRTIFTGQVVYASFFDGFGVLVIVDHGDGFMSLYANNTETKVRVGDWVETQQVISRVQRPTSAQDSGLYFELRRSGKPIDPLLWFQTG